MSCQIAELLRFRSVSHQYRWGVCRGFPFPLLDKSITGLVLPQHTNIMTRGCVKVISFSVLSRSPIRIGNLFLRHRPFQSCISASLSIRNRDVLLLLQTFLSFFLSSRYVGKFIKRVCHSLIYVKHPGYPPPSIFVSALSRSWRNCARASRVSCDGSGPASKNERRGFCSHFPDGTSENYAPF